MTAIQVKEYITDKNGNKKSVIIDIDEFKRIERFLPIVDPDSEVFESRRNEDTFPIEECDEILSRIEKDRLDIVAIRKKNERTYK